MTPAGHLIVIDPEGAEIAASRVRIAADMPREQFERIRAELEAGMGPGCYVEFRGD